MANNTVTIGSGSDDLVLLLNEDAYAGDAQFTVSIDGNQIGGTQTATALRSSGTTQMFNVLGSFAAGTHTATIDFLNDAYGGTASTDRNLFLTQASLNGTPVANSTKALTSGGPQSFTFVAAGSAPATVNLGAGPDLLSLAVSEDAYLGDAQFTITVDGKQVGGTQTAGASHAAGASQLFNIAGSFGAGPHSVSINFLNDAWGGTSATDRNLYVTAASLNGAAIAGSSLTLLSAGSQSFGFQVAGATPTPTPPPTGPDTLVVYTSEDAYLGDAQFTVSVDGVQVGSTYTATAIHGAGATSPVTLNGNWGSGAHTVSVTFLNDAYGGTANTDRNLYIDKITYNGATVGGTPYELASAGAHPFSVPPVTVPTPTPTPVPTPTPTPTGPAFYVAVGGNDAADGSLAHPFATLTRAVRAMETSTTHTTFVEGGNYGLTSAVALTGADSGFTIAGYQNQRPVLFDATNSLPSLITLNGASNVSISSLSLHAAGRAGMQVTGGSGNQIFGNQIKDAGTALSFSHTVGNLVSGNEIDNSTNIGIELYDGANANVIDSNVINGVLATSTSGAAVFAHGVNNNVVSHNLVENTAGAGIAVMNWDSFTTINVGNTVDYNVITNTGYATGYDTGAIYVLGRAEANTQMTIDHNYIDHTGAGGNAHTVAIYLDDGASGVTVTNNIARNVGTHGFQVHGGHDDSFVNNIFALDPTSASIALFQAINNDPNLVSHIYNDVVRSNIITSPNSPQLTYDNLLGGTPAVSNNLYFNTSGGQFVNAVTSDSSPKFGDPRFVDAAGGNYNLASGSAAAQVGFVQIDQSGMGVHPTTPTWF